MTRLNVWIDDAKRLLADGEWHDGLEWLLAAERHIAPGVAQRQNEEDRRRVNRSRKRRALEKELGRPPTAEELGEDEERVVPLSVPAQIAAGKRSLVVKHVFSNVQGGGYEVDPWPVPKGGWKSGGWKIRQRKRWALQALEKRFHVSTPRLRELIAQEPALTVETFTRVTYLPDSEVPALEERVKAYREASRQRRSEAARRRVAQPRPVTHLSLSALARRAGVHQVTAQKVQAAHPELGWEQRGRNMMLPVERAPEWDRLVKEYMDGFHERRSEVNRRTALERAERNRQ